MIHEAISQAKTGLSVKTQTLATLSAIVAAVALPQIFHTIGIISGTGAAPGTVFLPMYLPILLVGLWAGAYAGAVAGLFAPLISFALSGMPTAAMLPIITAELIGTGLFAGLLRNSKMPVFGKVLATQVLAKGCRAIITLGLIYLAGNSPLPFSSVWMSAVTGLPGILLQWTFIPLILFYVENKNNHEN